MEKSVSLYKRACELMPGGVSSPVRAFKSVGGNPLFMKKGAGAHVFDEDGNDYIDYCMSWGPLILGHADGDVVAAVVDAAHSGTSFGTPNRHEVELAEMVVARFSSIEKVRFVSSGTEAVMSAVRLARGYTGRDKIIKCDGCYHGHADHLLVAGGSGLATFGTPDSAGVTADNARDTVVVPYNDLDRLEDALKKHAGSVAAVIMEPVPCNYGLIPPYESHEYAVRDDRAAGAIGRVDRKRKNYLHAVRALCDTYSALLIFDEVITGFRLARGGAQEYFDVRADITTLGKIIGGGLPVGAYGASKEIMAKVAPDGPVYQAGTLSGNPLAMRAGIATLARLEKIDAYRLLDKKAETFRALLSPLAEKYAGKLLALQMGSIFALYFTDRRSITTVDQVRACDMKAFGRFHGEMLARGVYLSPSGYEVGFLSTAHSDEDLARTAMAMEEALGVVLR
ncbi:MAG TPA: glutamate-1-semialdehyde 2,1-aminomutase [Spirochaetota bacterium]|nr:glutamate-1-semialdehyde 2,1-aminomutase [Spirochaetota bacterium]